MENRYFMGLDFGTQGVRCGIIDENGAVAASCEAKYDTKYPRPGWAEQRPSQWEECLSTAVFSCRETAGHDVFSRIASIAVCSTASTVIAVDANGAPLRNAILWMDVRSVNEAQKINATNHPALRHCGGEDSVEWLVPKMLWLKENEPEIFNKASRIVEQQDYINHYLTGEWCSSVSQSTCKANYVEELGGFAPDFFEAIGLPEFFEKANTRVIKQGQEVGKLRGGIARGFGLSPNVKVYQGGIDAHINMIGLGVNRPGQTGVVLGSSFVHLAMVEKPLFKEGIWGPYKDAIIPDAYCLEGGQVSAGSITKWFLKEFDIKGQNPYLTIADEAAKVPIGCEGVVALDFFQGNRTPYKDPLAKGVFYGLTLSHTRAHMYRAVLESIAFGTRNILDSMSGKDTEINEIRACGGVVNNPLWLQIIADVTRRPVVLTEQSGMAGVLGCAVIAAVGVGHCAGFGEACGKMVHTTRVIEPNESNSKLYDAPYNDYHLLYDSLKQMMHRR